MARSNNQNIEKLTDVFVSRLKEALENQSANTKRPYVIKYLVKGELHGYHASTFCQLTQDPYSAKRYDAKSQESVNSQREIITNNLFGTLRQAEKGFGNSLADILRKPAYKQYWEGVSPDDVFVDIEFLDSNASPQNFEVKKV